MSLVKAIKAGKEKRKPYFGCKSFDSSCRPHGGCPWCEGNRFHSHKLRKMTADEKLNEWKAGIDYNVDIELSVEDPTDYNDFLFDSLNDLYDDLNDWEEDEFYLTELKRMNQYKKDNDFYDFVKPENYGENGEDNFEEEVGYVNFTKYA